MKPTLIPFILLGIHSLIISQSLHFSRVYKTPAYEDARCMAASGNGEYVVTGLDKSGNDPSGDMYAMKINAAGAILWKQYYGKPKEDGGNFILKTRDDGYLISGHTNNSANEECDGYLVKINRDGKKEWEILLGTALDDACQGAVESEDGTIYVTGRYEEQNGSQQFDVLLGKLSANGNLIWLKPIERNESEEGYRIALGSDQSLIIAGYSVNLSSELESMLVIKTDLNGNSIWQKSWKTNFNERAMLVIPLENGSCIVGGGSANKRYVNDCEKIILKKLNTDGSILAELNAADLPLQSTYLFDGIKFNNNTFVVSGIYSISEKPFVAVIDDQLNIVNLNPFEESNHSRPLSISLLNKDELLVCGKEMNLDQDYDIWLSRTRILPGLVLNSTNLNGTDIIEFPNPWFDSYYIYTSGEENKILQVFELSGNCIMERHYSGKDFFIYRQELPHSGEFSYLLQDANGKMLHKGSFIKI